VANFYSAAERRSRGALWPSFAPALIRLPWRNELVWGSIYPGDEGMGADFRLRSC